MGQLTEHARIRCQQRGITWDRLEAVYSHADIELPAARGCILVLAGRQKVSTQKSGEQLRNVFLSRGA